MSSVSGDASASKCPSENDFHREAGPIDRDRFAELVGVKRTRDVDRKPIVASLEPIDRPHLLYQSSEHLLHPLEVAGDQPIGPQSLALECAPDARRARSIRPQSRRQRKSHRRRRRYEGR